MKWLAFCRIIGLNIVPYLDKGILNNFLCNIFVGVVIDWVVRIDILEGGTLPVVQRFDGVKFLVEPLLLDRLGPRLAVRV